MRPNLRIVKQERPKMLSLCEHDMHLPKLGKMRFVMTPVDDGFYLIYIKDEDFSARSYDEHYREGIPTKPYCYGKVSLNEWERFFGITIEDKVRRKIAKLKNWVIEQDILLGYIQGSNRKVNL